MEDPDVVVWGHDEQWHLVKLKDEFILCSMGRGSPMQYRDDQPATCLLCIDMQSRGYLTARSSHFASMLNV
jgi:hypothetical protein